MLKNICKKGFTAAEVLMVMAAIGLIATLTVPTSMKSMYNKQKVAGYKLAYQTVEKAITDTITENYGDTHYVTEPNTQKLWRAIYTYVSAQGFACVNYSKNDIVKANQIYGKATFSDNSGSSDTVGKGSKSCTLSGINSPWIVLESGMAFAVESHGGMSCKSVMEINEQNTLEAAVQSSCAQVFVDVNGLNKGPNKGNSIAFSGTGPKVAVDLDTKLDEALYFDRFRIFVGNDGITAGPKAYTETGRIMYEEY